MGLRTRQKSVFHVHWTISNHNFSRPPIPLYKFIFLSKTKIILINWDICNFELEKKQRNQNANKILRKD